MLQSLGGLDVASVVFYAFAFILTCASILVISARNSVHSVFFLILAFFTAAGLLVLIGAEYLAMTLVIVYVGAVAVLFLFVVMMLNVNFAALRSGFLAYLPVGLLVAGVLFVQLVALLYISLAVPSPHVPAVQPLPDAADLDNASAIGRVLYTDYVHLFQLAGIVLLIAMIGAITLTLRQRPGVKKQKIAGQLARKRGQAIEMTNPKSGQGVS